MGEEGLGATTDGQHHLTGPSRTDRSGDPADLADDGVIVAVDDMPCHGSPQGADAPVLAICPTGGTGLSRVSRAGRESPPPRWRRPPTWSRTACSASTP